MRNIIYTTLIVLSFSSGSIAQNCTPDPNMTTNGFSPKQLDTAFVGVPYNMILQVRALKDTIIIFGGFPLKAFVDSILVEKILGLPASISYACNNNRCRFVPDTTGCAKISGTAVKADAGVHQIRIAILIYGKLESGFKATQRDTVRSFSLVVRDLNGILEEEDHQTDVYPNPANDGKINVHTSTIHLPAVIRMYSPTGQLLSEEKIIQTDQTIDISSYKQPWVYLRLDSITERNLWQQKLLIAP